jgi:hypothetical protein
MLLELRAAPFQLEPVARHCAVRALLRQRRGRSVEESAGREAALDPELELHSSE